MIGPANQEVRVSLDYHGVLDLSWAGDSETAGIHPHNSRLLHLFFNRYGSLGWRVGVTSYIGYHSHERRSGLERAVREFNQGRNGPGQLGLQILSTRDKSNFLQQAGAHVHVDDRSDTLNLISDCGINTVHLCEDRFRSRHVRVTNLGAALDHIVSSRPQARVHDSNFEYHWPIPQ